jgi:DNA polymerase-3 subunit gamma/tau
MGLYQKYRPQRLKDMVGQDDTIAALLGMLERGFPHASLFTGPSGCGKTTAALILARRLGCKSSYNLVHTNVADERSIDNVRDISKLHTSPPMFGDRARVWILDEVHQMTRAAQEALLLPLENMPETAYFFLCTNQPDRLIPTIHTRCTPLKFGRIHNDDLESLAREVAAKEKLKIADDIWDVLIAHADGSARQVLTLLEKVVGLDTQQALTVLDIDKKEEGLAYQLGRILMYEKKGWNEALPILKQIEDPERFRHMMLAWARTEMLKGERHVRQGYLVHIAFKEPYYSCPESGLVASCWEVLQGR